MDLVFEPRLQLQTSIFLDAQMCNGIIGSLLRPVDLLTCPNNFGTQTKKIKYQKKLSLFTYYVQWIDHAYLLGTTRLSFTRLTELELIAIRWIRASSCSIRTSPLTCLANLQTTEISSGRSVKRDVLLQFCLITHLICSSLFSSLTRLCFFLSSPESILASGVSSISTSELS